MRALLLVLYSLLCVAAPAEDWPQWRGPQRNGVTGEAEWLRGWPDGKPPRVAWRAKVGKGHSAVSVWKQRAYTMGWDGTQDTVYCLAAANGKLLWKQSYPCGEIVQWSGPRSTPTVADGVVYTLGQHGQLYAWNALTGQKVWHVLLPAAYQPDVDYGFAWSPLLFGNLLLFGAGRKGLAMDRRSGAYVWGNDGQHGSCASPVPFVHQGQAGVALITTDPGRESVSLVAVAPATGRELWRSDPWREKWGAACVDLLIAGNKVFLTTGEQMPRCARFTITGTGLKEDWSNNRLAVYTGGCVLLGEHLYAVTRTGILKCLDWNTGEERWSRRGFGGHGTLIAANGKLIVQSSTTGEIVVAEANPAAYRELRRTVVFPEAPETFTAAALSEGRLYCRSYAGEVVCLDFTRKTR